MRIRTERSGRANYFLKNQIYRVSCFDHYEMQIGATINLPNLDAPFANGRRVFLSGRRGLFPVIDARFRQGDLFSELFNIAQKEHGGACILIKSAPGVVRGAFVMRHQEIHSKHSVDLGRAFSKLIRCADCDQHRPMRIKAVYPALYRGRDILFCECPDCGAEKAEFATSPQMESNGSGQPFRMRA